MRYVALFEFLNDARQSFFKFENLHYFHRLRESPRLEFYTFDSRLSSMMEGDLSDFLFYWFEDDEENENDEGGKDLENIGSFYDPSLDVELYRSLVDDAVIKHLENVFGDIDEDLLFDASVDYKSLNGREQNYLSKFNTIKTNLVEADVNVNYSPLVGEYLDILNGERIKDINSFNKFLKKVYKKPFLKESVPLTK